MVNRKIICLLKSLIVRGGYYQLKNAMRTGENTNIINWQMHGERMDYNLPKCDCQSTFTPVIAHTYWQGEVGEKQLFSIKSFLCTQQMENFEIWLWLEENSYEANLQNSALQRLVMMSNHKLVLKKWNVFLEIQSTPAENGKSYFRWSGKPLPFIADDFRIIALYKYGGLYFDLDVMFCRDLSPLLMRGEFVYAWEKQPFANNDLLFLHKRSALAECIIKKMIKEKSSQPWVVFHYDDLNLRFLTVYPCYMFDPLWNGYVDGMPIQDFDDFFREFSVVFKKDEKVNSFKDFFTGIYAYHWHNRWKSLTREDSYFGLFNKEFDMMMEEFNKNVCKRMVSI